MSAVQDEHTLRLERIESDIQGLRSDLPGMIVGAVREALRKD